MALTRITKGVIKPNQNYDTHDINSTGIITATGGNITGNLTVGGVLTYEDVTSIDSIGIITARNGLVSPYADIDDFVSVGSNIHLGNAGVVTATSFVGSGAALTGIDATAIKDSGGNVKVQAQASGAVYTGIHTFNSGAEVGSNIKLGNAGVVTATSFTGSGANLTSLPAGQLTGTVADARISTLTASKLSGALPAISGANLTNLDASDLASGTVPTARLGSGTANSSTFLRGDSTFAAKSTLFGNLSHGQNFLDDNNLIFGDASDMILIHQASGAKSRIRNTNDSGSLDIESTLTRFTNKDGSTEKVRITSGGTVNIGGDYTNTSGKLKVTGNSIFNGDIDVDGHTNLDNVSIAGVTTFSSNVTISPSGDPILTITGSGHPQLTLTNTSGSDHCGVNFGDSSDYNAGMIQYTNGASNDYMVFHTAGGERLRITSAGHVGVNEPSPQRYFQVTGNASYGAAHFGVAGTNAGNAYIGNTPVVTISTDGNANAGTNDEKAILQVGRGGGGAGAAAVTTDLFRVNLGGSVQIGGAVGSNSDIDIANTKLTIKQTANNREDGIYLERTGERRGWLMFVGGSGSYNDAFCLSTNQLGTKTDVLAIDRGNRLAKLGGDVIIDSTNNGYGGLRIYDDSSGGYNVNYVGGRSDGNMSHVFKSGGRSQNQSPWTDASGSEIMRVSLSNGLQLQGDTDSALQYHTGDHYKFKTKDRERVHLDNRGVLTAPKLSTKALIFSPVTNKWASSRTVTNFVMQFYTGASSATYHFMRMISQPDWAFDDVEITQYRYQYNPSGSDHTVRRYYTYYGSHSEQIVRYNQNGSGTGTGNDNYINKRSDFGPGGSFTIHQASNGGYYRDLYGSDYAISLGAYYGVVLEIKITATVGIYDTGDYPTAYDFYPANYGGQATQTNANNHGGPRGVWFNTTSNGTGSGTAPVVSNKNSDRGWHTGSNFLDVSL